MYGELCQSCIQKLPEGGGGRGGECFPEESFGTLSVIEFQFVGRL